MLENGLEIKISSDDYSKKTIDEKLNILYQVGLTQQQTCVVCDGRITTLETARRLDKAKLAGISVGSGGGAAALYGVIKGWLSGGG